MLPRRPNNTRAERHGIIKEGRGGGATQSREAKDRTTEQGWEGYSLQEEEVSLCPSARFFISGQIPRPHSCDRPEQFVHPSRPRPPVPPTQTASILSNIQPVRPERERLTMQSAARPTYPLVRRSVLPSAVVKSSTFRISQDYIPFLCSPDAAPLLPRHRRRCRSTLTRPPLSFQWCKTLRRRRWSVKSNFVKQDEPRRSRPAVAARPLTRPLLLADSSVNPWACGGLDGEAQADRRTTHRASGHFKG